MDPGRALQGLDHVGQELEFNAMNGILRPITAAHVQVADYTLGTFVHEERISKNSPTLDGRIAGKDFGIHVAENHLRRAAIVPGKQARPHLRLALKQGAQVRGGKVPEVEDLWCDDPLFFPVTTVWGCAHENFENSALEPSAWDLDWPALAVSLL